MNLSWKSSVLQTTGVLPIPPGVPPTPAPPPPPGISPAPPWAGDGYTGPWPTQTLDHCDPYLVWDRDTYAESPVTTRDGLAQTGVVMVLVEHQARPEKDNRLAGYKRPPRELGLRPTYQLNRSDPRGKVQAYTMPRQLLPLLVQSVIEGRIVRFEMASARLRDAEDYKRSLPRLVDQAVNWKGLRSLDTTDLRALPLLRALQSNAFLNGESVVNDALLKRRVFRRATAPPTAEMAAPPVVLAEPLLGIIDDLCPFASPALRRDDGTYCVISLVDQGLDAVQLDRRRRSGADMTDEFTASVEPSPSGPAPEETPGGEDEEGDDDGDGDDPTPITEFRPPGPQRPSQQIEGYPQEPSIYRRTGYVEVLRNWGHGTAVTSAAVQAACADGDRLPDIAWVQLPDETAEDTSGGSLAGRVLDGIRHILGRADGRRTVVNVSYGTHAGPHDGTSLFEAGLRALLSTHPHLHVVLPAGNSHLGSNHASFSLGPNSDRLLQWKLLPDDTTDSFVEIWLTSHEDIEVRLEPPSGPAESVIAGNAKVLTSTTGDGPPHITAGIVFPRRVPQGQHGTMCLVAVAPTRTTDDSISSRNGASRTPLRAPHGVWLVTVINHSNRHVRVHAWIQRDGTAPGRGRAGRAQRGRQSYFVDLPDAPIDPSSTLNGIATLPPEARLRVVGAMRALDGNVSLYSGAGPNRDEPSRTGGPDVCAVGDFSIAQPGLLVGGTLSGSRLRVAGTSIAAAVFAGRWYRHLVTCTAPSCDCLHFPPPDKEPWQPIETCEQPRRAAEWLRGAWQRMPPQEPSLVRLTEGKSRSDSAL